MNQTSIWLMCIMWLHSDNWQWNDTYFVSGLNDYALIENLMLAFIYNVRRKIKTKEEDEYHPLETRRLLTQRGITTD